jgi:hypothetical protein
MEKNLQVRAAPNTSGNRNGMPPSGGYVYRGWYIDVMPWAITDDCSTDYDGDTEPVTRDETKRCSRCARKHVATSRHAAGLAPAQVPAAQAPRTP